MSDALGELVCRVRTARVPPETGHLTKLLDRVEHHRRERYREDVDRHRFTAAAALNRLTLADHTGCRPADIRIDRTCEECGGPHGRPRVDIRSRAAIDVSVTHAGSFVAVALVEQGRVGVDIDVVPADYHDLIDAVAHSDERAGITSAHQFTQTWVRKEAILKAHGAGLRIEPNGFVAPEPGRTPSLVRLPGIGPLTCRLVDLDVDDDHLGSVAVLTATAVRFEIEDATTALAP